MIFPRILAAALALSSTAAPAIVIRHDVPDERYRAKESDYPFVFPIYRTRTGLRDCIATLIAPQWGITAAHCTEDSPLVKALAKRETFSVETEGGKNAIDRVERHPPFANGTPVDIALVHLVRPVPGVRPIAIYRGHDELGRVIIMPGWGGFGDGKNGLVQKSDGLFRVAENRVDAARDGELLWEFDDPRSGLRRALPLEGISGPGDSGGPALIMTPTGWAVAGISSGQQSFDRPEGRYQVVEIFPRVSDYADWIDGIIR